jgi:hypothetical protein
MLQGPSPSLPARCGIAASLLAGTHGWGGGGIAFGYQLLDVTVAQAEAKVKPDIMADDLRGAMRMVKILQLKANDQR